MINLDTMAINTDLGIISAKVHRGTRIHIPMTVLDGRACVFTESLPAELRYARRDARVLRQMVRDIYAAPTLDVFIIEGGSACIDSEGFYHFGFDDIVTSISGNNSAVASFLVPNLSLISDLKGDVACLSV